MNVEFDPVLDYPAEVAAYKRSKQRLQQIDTTGWSPSEKAHVAAMIRDCEYIIEWLETGRRPGNRRGIERRSKEQREFPVDVDTVRRYMYGGKRGSTDGSAGIPEEQVIMMEEALSILTTQQRDAYIMVKVNRFSLENAADVMGLKKTTVQNHVDRAQLKISAFIAKYHYQLSLPITG
jgi:RNA polymerase sigma-70 factor (ECF subfamily)